MCAQYKLYPSAESLNLGHHIAERTQNITMNKKQDKLSTENKLKLTIIEPYSYFLVYGPQKKNNLPSAPTV